MQKFELSKTIEARKLNKRTGSPLSEPPVTISFGAIVENPAFDHDAVKFTYLTERYQCAEVTFREATAHSQPGQPPLAEAPSERAAAIPQPPLRWEGLESGLGRLHRAKVPGGWLVLTPDMNALAFYPDPQHTWDGTSLP